jgi:flavin-binding protein dodecin
LTTRSYRSAARHCCLSDRTGRLSGHPYSVIMSSIAGIQSDYRRVNPMAKSKKKTTDSVYRIVDVVGVSEKSWEDAGRRAVETASASLRDLRVAEVTKMDMKVEDGKVTAFRTRVALSFKYEA